VVILPAIIMFLAVALSLFCEGRIKGTVTFCGGLNEKVNATTGEA
jgi:hypothetical protein